MSNNSVESIEDRVAELIGQPLHPELFKPAGSVTQCQVLSAFGNVTVGLHKDVIEALVEKVQSIKTDVRSWGLHQVRAKIVKNFNQCSPGGSFCTIGQVADYWKENGTVEAAGKLWYACYGAFDDEPGWEVNLEQTYMEMCEYTYRATEGRRKGCFSRTIGQRKTDIIKMINRASENTHHGVIRMKRLPEEMDAKTKFKKRKKGTTLGGFVKLDGQVKYEPQQHKIEETKVRKCLRQVVLNKSDSNNCCCSSSTTSYPKESPRKTKRELDTDFVPKHKTRRLPPTASPASSSSSKIEETKVRKCLCQVVLNKSGSNNCCCSSSTTSYPKESPRKTKRNLDTDLVTKHMSPKHKTRRLPQTDASPASSSSSTASLSSVESPVKPKGPRTARSFEEKQEVTKFKVRRTVNEWKLTSQWMM
jgi:hypothetical protein